MEIKELTTKNLRPGLLVKDYKELCNLVEQPLYAGDQKKVQLKEFERFFEYEKSGRKFLITEIYDEPAPHETRIAANAKYVQSIQALLLSYLATQKKEKVYITQTQLWSTLGIINENYLPMQKRKDKLLQLDEHMSKFEINNFYQRSRSKFTSIIETSLKSLKRRYLIDYEETYKIGAMVPVSKGVEIMEYHDASEDEKVDILRIKHDCLRSMGYEMEKQLFFDGKIEEYYNNLNHIFQEEKGWSVVYSCYKILFDRHNAEVAADEDMEKLRLNQNVLEAVNAQAEKSYNNSLEKKVKEENSFLYPANYVKLQKLLAEKLIDLSQKQHDEIKLLDK